jgi:predicted nucleic acid-binding protein
MATGRNFSMSAINSGHPYLPTYQILMISANVEFLPPFLCRVLAAILKMADIMKNYKLLDVYRYIIDKLI